MLGQEEHHLKQVKVVNRIITWEGHNGIIYEADPRHVEIVVEQLNLKDARTASTPGTKEEGSTQSDNETPLEDREASLYRAIVARCNYLSPDRPDIVHTVKELARKHGRFYRRRLATIEKTRPVF